jgi:uncharacterized glyoxalase superfamily protein PhnB
MATGATMIPFLRYEDADAALRFLVEAFGFEERAVHRGEGDAIEHAELAYGNGMVMIGSIREDGGPIQVKSPKQLGGASQGIYVVVDDPDAHHDHAKAAGAEILTGLTDQDYGSREYIALDPEGNVWSFGTYDPFATGGG